MAESNGERGGAPPNRAIVEPGELSYYDADIDLLAIAMEVADLGGFVHMTNHDVARGACLSCVAGDLAARIAELVDGPALLDGLPAVSALGGCRSDRWPT